MNHFKVKVGKVNEPTCLSVVKRLGLAKIGEVLVISENLHQEGGDVKVT